MKNILFLDDSLDNSHANTYSRLLREEFPSCGFKLAACASLNPSTGREWAQKQEIPYCEDVRELKGEIDAVAVLAPSTPHTHSQLIARACELGVPIYADKTIAMRTSDLEEIFAMVDRAGVPFFTSSALRFADELVEFKSWQQADELLQMQVYSGGGSLHEYIVHPLETLISVMGAEVSEHEVRRTGSLSQILLKYHDGRLGTVFMYPKSHSGFRVIGAKTDKTLHLEIKSPFFKNLLGEILGFFGTGVPPVPREQTAKIVEIIETATAF